jgi:hypothetical protein
MKTFESWPPCLQIIEREPFECQCIMHAPLDCKKVNPPAADDAAARCDIIDSDLCRLLLQLQSCFQVNQPPHYHLILLSYHYSDARQPHVQVPSTVLTMTDTARVTARFIIIRFDAQRVTTGFRFDGERLDRQRLSEISARRDVAGERSVALQNTAAI